MIARGLFQVYIRTPTGFERWCFTKWGRVLKNARRAADKARLLGGHVQIGNRVVWAAGSGWAPDVAARLAQEAAASVRARRTVATRKAVTA